MKERLCSDLQRIQAWIASSRMKLNVNKSSIMWFARKCASSVVLPTILVDDHQLKEVDEQKYLGIIFDRHLQWGPQFTSVCGTVCHTSYIYLAFTVSMSTTIAEQVHPCYYHVSGHHRQLNWLPVSDQIKFKHTCAMFCYYHKNTKPCLVLDPPISFGPQHSYHTHCKDSFANLQTCHLSSTFFPSICHFLVEFSH